MPPRPRTMSRDPTPAVSGIVERFAGLWSALAGAMLAWSMVRPYLPRHLLPDRLAGGSLLRCHARSLLAGLLDPYLTVTLAEYGGGEGMRRGAAYERAAAYLGARCAREARTLRSESARDGGGRRRFVLRVDDGEEVADEFRGAMVWWHAVPAPHHRHGGPRCDAPGEDAGRTYHRLVFHQRLRDLVVDSYLPHVCREGRAIMEANRRRKLFTNAGERYGKSSWKHVAFKHPSTFATLAMDPAKKREIMDDLDAGRRRIGKAWKRGYLLYGPPGTGKSSMIAAMANYLDYDIYDIELTSVSTNTELRRMFIDTKGKSIIVIEDIDCSLDLTGKRRSRQQPLPGPADDDADAPPPEPTSIGRVTLSGLLNFSDGLWSACGGERVIVFTTNHAEWLDPALIRRGRMDKHIEMSYCCFESFRFLARNYLALDAHPLFDDIRAQLQEVDITPANVAELLTPKRAGDDEGSCLAGLVEALREAAAAAAAATKNATSNNIQEDGEVVEDE
ncbi:hypothetical protein GQ55_2G059100 [Panicum hallii var. hallii]|uniref:AAA+ ATPase domain-containing protein n=1 Tax=Panicum hallii var. hallii TaxID=1504633 RepID=A0A2T7ELV3_9POAL|nr:hypothetical protein GQ55_2G059100 [Panicum hallii var. hallii]